MTTKPNSIRVPLLNPNDDSVKIVSLHMQNGDYVSVGQSIATIETSKATVDIESNASGYLQWHYKNEQHVKVGEILASLYEQKNFILQNDEKFISANDNEKNSVILSNEAKAYIQENNIDAKLFQGKGLITLRMVKNLIAQKLPKDDACLNEDNFFRKLTSEKLDANKLAEIKILERGQKSALISSLTVHFYSYKIRNHISKIKILNRRILPYIIFVLIQQLKDYPKFTAYFKNDAFHYYNEIKIGLAMDIGKGLKVIVLRNLENKSVIDIHFEILDCIEKYYNEKLMLEDLVGSTITISDLSNDNILQFQPLLNVNQSVIFGIGGDETLENSPMSITAVFDHRILSGQEVAEFLHKLKTKLISDENINEALCLEQH